MNHLQRLLYFFFVTDVKKNSTYKSSQKYWISSKNQLKFRKSELSNQKNQESNLKHKDHGCCGKIIVSYCVTYEILWFKSFHESYISQTVKILSKLQLNSLIMRTFFFVEIFKGFLLKLLEILIIIKWYSLQKVFLIFS